MTNHAFDTFARQAASALGLNRRASLKVLGAAALVGALSRPDVIQAAKSSRVAKRVSRKCRREVGQCQTFVAGQCAALGGPDIDACEALISPCCDFLGSCNAGAMFECLADISESQ